MFYQLAPTHTYFSCQDGDLLHTHYPLHVRINHKHFLSVQGYSKWLSGYSV